MYLKKSNENKLSVYKQQKHPFLHLRASCLETGRITIPPNQYQTLFSAKDHCVQNSEESVNYRSYHTETILSTEVITQKPFCLQSTTEVITQKPFCLQSTTEVITQKPFCLVNYRSYHTETVYDITIT